MTESIRNPLTLYLTRLAPSSQLTMRYVLQDAADRLGFEDINLEEIDWHLLQPEQGDRAGCGLARGRLRAPIPHRCMSTAVRGVMNEAWRMSLISQEHLLKIRTVKGCARYTPEPGAQSASHVDPRNDGRMRCRSAPPGPARDAAVIGILYGSGNAQVGVGQPRPGADPTLASAACA